jgi:hypothetical protein
LNTSSGWIMPSAIKPFGLAGVLLRFQWDLVL